MWKSIYGYNDKEFSILSKEKFKRMSATLGTEESLGDILFDERVKFVLLALGGMSHGEAVRVLYAAKSALSRHSTVNTLYTKPLL